MKEMQYRICSRCVMDTSDPLIVFDQLGCCNHCSGALGLLEKIAFKDEQTRKREFERLVSKISEAGKRRKYDCIIGLSGGVDSSYLAYVVKNAGLRPLAVHLDNGWNSELAVQNIEQIVKKLKIDLYTYVIDWEEFRDLQLAYLKASVLDLEVLSDNAIVVAISRIMKKYGVNYFLIGFNYSSESIMPSSWLYHPKHDSLNIKSIYSKFGSGRKLKTYPLFSLREFLQYTYQHSDTTVPLLNYINYNKIEALEILKREFGWRDYGGKHYESKITQFYQAFILPHKFHIDKRRAHLSSLICSKQLTREEALDILDTSLYDPVMLLEDREYFIKKLGLTESEFGQILSTPPVLHSSFPSYTKIISKLNPKRLFKR